MQPSNATPSSVWQKRTNRLIAVAIIVIGLTMMISNITQCIYIGMLFIVIALIWLAWMTVKERKIDPPRPEDQPSPVLFLVTSHMLPAMNHPAVGSSSDKPPSYDAVLSLEDLPPDYSTVLPEKPPRYEDAFPVPHCSTSTCDWNKRQMFMMENTLDVSRDSTESNIVIDITRSPSRDSLLLSSASSMLSRTAQANGTRASSDRFNDKQFDPKQGKQNMLNKLENKNNSNRSRAPNSSPLSRRNCSPCGPLPNRTRHLSNTGSRTCDSTSFSGSRSLPRLLQLQVPTLTQDTARRLSNYFSRTPRDTTTERDENVARTVQSQLPAERPVPLTPGCLRASNNCNQIEYDDTRMKINARLDGTSEA
ncbi:hypothetical protein FHG87_000255 [Trinorchestia longiramus]|nr:hypothetical protein FHG87_000255 [Trinorchestia longiramus]